MQPLFNKATASLSHPQLHYGSALEEMQTLRFPIRLAAL